MFRKILIIAGLDPSGNAGIVRDLEIAHSFPLHPSCVATALTAQNSKKFFKAQVISRSIFQNQLRAIEPLSQYQAIKIGMLGGGEIVAALVSFLKRQKKIPPIVLDPVMESSTGSLLLDHPGRKLLWDKLLPLASLWTPNLDEASYFAAKIPPSPPFPPKADPPLAEIKGGGGDLGNLAQCLWDEKRKPVFLKGGHLKTKNKVTDFYIDDLHQSWLINPRLKKKPRGTGCALSTLISCFVAIGFPLVEGVSEARKVMQEWIRGK